MFADIAEPSDDPTSLSAKLSRITEHLRKNHVMPAGQVGLNDR